MPLELACLQKDFPDLIPETILGRHGETAYRLRLPRFNLGREFGWAEVRIPRGFPEDGVARIALSPDAILRIPHVEEGGYLCISGDPGPASGLSANDRLLTLLIAYQEQFLEPWQQGELDDDFRKEPLNYWAIFCERAKSSNNPAAGVWTVDSSPDHPRIHNGILVFPKRIVIAGDSSVPLVDRMIRSLGNQAKQQCYVLIAEIPINDPLTPRTWPSTYDDLMRLLQSYFTPLEHDRFYTTQGRRGRSPHRIALLRNQSYAIAYLLPGGPPTRIDDGDRAKTYPSRTTLLPLPVFRIDPAWMVGRDQHREVESRQGRHVLILGAGALGSQGVEHLAKAGVGKITLVDDDTLVPANLGRHLLGAESIGMKKAESVAKRVNLAHPSAVVTPFVMKAEKWLKGNSLASVDLVLDLTGEPDVRWLVDQARRLHPCPCLIGWMEPFVAAAHVCRLPPGTLWLQDDGDAMTELEAVDWPDEVIRQEPGCSSRFQSYTAVAAAYTVAMVAESALLMLDTGSANAQVASWVRGQQYLDAHWPGLSLRDWARPAAPHNGILIERPFP